ncbi:MAG: hypothetical protein WC455_24990 [Dehalococcoidia bacterium]
MCDESFTQYLDRLAKKLETDLRIDSDRIELDKKSGSMLLRLTAIVFTSVASMAQEYQRTSGHDMITDEDIFHALLALDINCKLMRRMCSMGTEPPMLVEMRDVSSVNRVNTNGEILEDHLEHRGRVYGVFVANKDEKRKLGETRLDM